MTCEPYTAYIGVGEEGISLLDVETLSSIVTYSYSSVVTFGGSQEDFMLVVAAEANTQKLLFAMSKSKVHLNIMFVRVLPPLFAKKMTNS